MRQKESHSTRDVMVILVGAILALFIISCSNPTHSSYTVTFDPNGGTLTGGGNTVVVATGSPVQEPDAPTRSGYTFDGWYLKGTEEKYDFSLPIIADITLEARWTAASGGTPTPTPTPPPTPTSYTVTYHALVDGQESNAIKVPVSTTVQSGSTLSAPAKPAYDDTTYFFIDWSTSKTEYSALPADYTVSAPVELWAVFVTKTSSPITSADEKLSYAFDETKRGYTVKAGTAATGEVVIPSTINGAPVVEIEAYAFSDNIAITAIELSGATNLKTIGDAAFMNCSNLKALTIPGSVKSIGQWILQIGSWDTTGESKIWTTNRNASIEVVIEEGASGLSNESFWGSPISSISIPSTIDTIPDYCFSNSRLSSIEFKGDIRTIGISAFYNCSNLSSIDLTGVESIGKSAFAHTGITSVYIPASVATVGFGAFENGEVILGSTGYQFDEGDSLTVTFEEGFNGLTTGSFYGAPISSITIPESVTIIPMSCFYYATMLTSVTLHDGITEIQNNAFFDADIKEIKLPANLRRIGDFAFDSCALTELTLPEGLVSIGQNAFRSNWITGTLVIPASVTTIGNKAFLGANISALEFGEGTELSIGSEAFASMRDLRDVTLPASLISLDIGAFSYSSNHSDNGNVGLYSLTVQNDDPDNIKLTGTSAKAIYCTLYVPDTEGVVDKYKASTTNWCAQNRFDATNIKPVSNKPTS